MSAERPGPGRIVWSYLIHLGFNMWEDRHAPELVSHRAHSLPKPYLRCDKPAWDEVLNRLAEAGANQVVIDLGEGVKYESHPEIAVEGSWTVQRLKAELDSIRSLGLEPIPKMNFSAAHDTWLGPYARCVSTGEYYRVCRDLIREAVNIFETPRFFHLGMDEETPRHQRYYAYMVVRQHELWWHDFKFYADNVRECGVRPWIWSDYLWHHPDAFFKNMDRDVMQSNWHYGTNFDPSAPPISAFSELDKNGYDQIPAGSTDSDVENLPALVEFCKRNIDSRKLCGFMQTVWRPTLMEYRDQHIEAVKALSKARGAYEKLVED